MNEKAPHRRSGARRRKAFGRAISATIVRAPLLWPAIRGFVRRFFDGHAAGWDDRVGTGSPEHLAPLAAALVRVPGPERALVIGTGTGLDALLVAREFPSARVRGVDLSEEMIRVATQRVGLDPEGRIAFKVADAADLPYPDEHFDLVALLNTPPFAGEIARVLRPGGHAIVASSYGARTPFYNPPGQLERAFRSAGMELAETGEAAEGTFVIARLPASPG